MSFKAANYADSLLSHALNDRMGVHASKLKCLYLPAQSGKTRKAEEMMKVWKMANAAFHDGDINIWISANNKLLTHQTGARFHKNPVLNGEEGSDDGDANMLIKDKIFTWTSGTKRTSISTEALAFNVLKGVDLILLCAHPKRLEYLAQMINNLTALPFFKKKINIWIDEADKSVELWKRHEAIAAIPHIAEVTLISASFDEVFEHYPRMGIIGAAETHPDCYRCLRDSTKVEINYERSRKPIDYIQHVLEKPELAERLTAPGVRAFIPGDYTKASHEAVAEYLLSKGFIVLILNGDKKEIRFPNGGEPINLRRYLRVSADPEDIPGEFNTILARLYKENNMSDSPFAVTGYICVQRGVTFQSMPAEDHDGFLFDYGILADIENRAEAYQTMARLFGNIGNHPCYKKADIYTTKGNFDRVTAMETIALNMARVAFEEGQSTFTKRSTDDLIDPEGADERDREALLEEARKKVEQRKMTVPIVLQTTHEEYTTITGTVAGKNALLALLSKTNPSLASSLRTYICTKVTEPTADYSYKRHVLTNLNAAIENKKTASDFDEEQKKKNIYKIVKDSKKNRIILTVYHGAYKPPRKLKAVAPNPFDE
jgi:hypothetical protein